MKTRIVSFLSRWASRLALVGLVAAVVVPAAAWILDRGFGREVLLVSPHDPSVVALDRSLWVPGDSVAELYGSPMSAPVRVLAFDGEALIHPVEDPQLVLLPVGPGLPHPIQIRTVWYFTRFLVAGLVVFAVVAALASLGVRRMARAHA